MILDTLGLKENFTVCMVCLLFGVGPPTVAGWHIYLCMLVIIII